MKIETSKGEFSVHSGTWFNPLGFHVEEDGHGRKGQLSQSEIKHLIRLIESHSNPDFRHRIPDTRFQPENAPDEYVFNFEVFASGEARVMYGYPWANFALPALWFMKSDSFPRATLTAKGLQEFHAALKGAAE